MSTLPFEYIFTVIGLAFLVFTAGKALRMFLKKRRRAAVDVLFRALVSAIVGVAVYFVIFIATLTLTLVKKTPIEYGFSLGLVVAPLTAFVMEVILTRGL